MDGPGRSNSRRCWMLMAMLTMALPTTGSVKAQTPTSKIAEESGAYIRARLVHAAPAPGHLWSLKNPQQRDPWLGFDKVQHATFGFLFTLGGQYVFVNKTDMSERGALPLSIGLAATAGLAKELWDRRSDSGVFSHRDLVADAVGILLATTVILI